MERVRVRDEEQGGDHHRRRLAQQSAHRGAQCGSEAPRVPRPGHVGERGEEEEEARENVAPLRCPRDRLDPLGMQAPHERAEGGGDTPLFRRSSGPREDPHAEHGE